MNPVVESLYARKSVRVFEDRPIGLEERRLILEAATQAPSAGNQQLYTILDIQSQELKERLADSCDHQPFIAQAKLVLVFCADCKKWYDGFRDCGCDPREPGIGDLLLAVSDTNIAAQNAVTAAQSMGIGSCYIGDIMENCETQREILGLPRYVFPATMVVFGYPTQQQLDRPKPERAPMERIVAVDRYPEMDEAWREGLFAYKALAKPYPEYMKAFCNRKFNSDFSREMTRSVLEYLKDFE